MNLISPIRATTSSIPPPCNSVNYQEISGGFVDPRTAKEAVSTLRSPEEEVGNEPRGVEKKWVSGRVGSNPTRSLDPRVQTTQPIHTQLRSRLPPARPNADTRPTSPADPHLRLASMVSARSAWISCITCGRLGYAFVGLNGFLNLNGSTNFSLLSAQLARFKVSICLANANKL